MSTGYKAKTLLPVMTQKQPLLETLELAAQELASALNLPAPRGQMEREALCRAARYALEAPHLEGVAVASPQWQAQSEKLDELLTAGTALTHLHKEFDRSVMPEAWEQDLGDLRRVLMAKGERFTRRLSGEYRRAEKHLAGLFYPPRPSDLESRLKLIDAVSQAQQHRETIEGHGPLGAELFGDNWSGPTSDWKAISNTTEWLQGLHLQVESGLVPGGIFGYLSGGNDRSRLGPLLQAVEQAAGAHAATALAIRNGLESARKELLDLGLRNPLLNYRLLRTRGLEAVDGVPAEVHGQLVSEGKALSFLPVAQPDADEETGALGQPTEEQTADGPAARQTQARLQTALSSQELQSRLLSTYHLANTFIQEQGVNTLFLALGMLTWRESDNGEPRKAPLVLLPVALDRTNVRTRFHLRHTGDDPGDNLSLRERLRSEFGVELPPLPDPEDLDVEFYLDAVSEAVREFPGWSVDRGSIVLGFFSFNKFLMYRDLDTEIWPDRAKPEEHAIIGALLKEGFNEPAPSISNDEHLDQYLPPDQVHHVVDADSSQTLALVDVNDGRNLMVQGPPGTGKSQTITNMIAEALGHGRTVLFVSEKMAALEVVKRRLDGIGLGDACLELHSHKSTKRVVLEELERTLELGRPRLGRIESDLETLANLRDRLNSYCEAVNTPVGETGVSPYQAYGELALIKQRTEGVQLPKLDLPSIKSGAEGKSWSQGDFRHREELVKELQVRLGTVGVPQEHPFWGSRRRVMLPTDLERLQTALPPAAASLEAVVNTAEDLANSMDLPTPSDVGEADALRLAVSRTLEAPQLSGLDLRAEEWRSHRKDLEALLQAGARYSSLRTRYQGTLKPDSWDLDLAELRELLDTKGRQLWRLLSSDYRRGKERLAGLCLGPPPSGLAAQLEMLDAVAEARLLGEAISAGDTVGQSAFGSRWQGESSDWDYLAGCSDWVWQLLSDVELGNLPTGIIDFLAEGRSTQGLAEASATVGQAVAQHKPNSDAVVEALDLDVAKRYPGGRSFDEQAFQVQQSALDSWGRRINDVHDIVGLNNISDTCAAAGLDQVFSLAEGWEGAASHLTDVFHLAWHEAVLGAALAEREELRGFDGANHHRLIQQFRELDTLALEHNRSRLAMAHWEGLPRQEGGGQIAVLKREFQKRSRHLPIRQLIERAGNAVQAIKPVFMMSPLSIATYIPQGSLTFDLVIFDEASQVKPVDAFGAILRAGQAVVVGDSQQLPPTSFFDTMSQGSEDDEDNGTGDIESVLGLFAAQNAPDRMLRWHYRSRHESLITVSNREFYNNRLVVFPSPDAERREGGLKLHLLPDTVYDRGGSRTNLQEAEAVAAAVMDHAFSYPHLTLGVAAFSVAQMRAIQDAVEMLRRADPSRESFFAAHADEPFFVKNLETVQGDERDVILISIGYGKDPEGNVAMNFGPLNWDGGERRLNVLITRARRRCEVFTNLTAEGVDVSRTSSPGILALKAFLEYAAAVGSEAATETGNDPGSSLERAVAHSLAGSGYELRPQVGADGHWVDLAVVDPARPGRYLMGIETDGETYHNSRSSRDRDRLREQVLNGLGWQIHHIWSTDWFNNPDRELQRAAEAIESAKNRRVTSQENESDTSTVPRESVATVSDAETVPEYQMAAPKANFADATFPPEADPSLTLWVAQVVDTESPVHTSEVARRIADAAGIRRGRRYQQALDRAIEHGVGSGGIARKGDFLWRPDVTEAPLRDRSKLPSSSRKIEFVAPEELMAAVRRVVAASFGIAFGDIAGAAVKLLGFGRVTNEMRSTVEPIISQMVTDGALARQGDLLLVSSGQSE